MNIVCVLKRRDFIGGRGLFFDVFFNWSISFNRRLKMIIASDKLGECKTSAGPGLLLEAFCDQKTSFPWCQSCDDNCVLAKWRRQRQRNTRNERKHHRTCHVVRRGV